MSNLQAINKEILDDDGREIIKKFNELEFLNGKYIGQVDFPTGEPLDDWDQEDINNKKLGTLKLLLELYQDIVDTYYRTYKALKRDQLKKLDDYYKITRKKLIDFIHSMNCSDEVIDKISIYENIIYGCTSIYDKEIVDGWSFFEVFIPSFINGWLYDKNLLDNSLAPLQYEKKEDIESFIKIVNKEIEYVKNIFEKTPIQNTKDEVQNKINTTKIINNFVDFEFSINEFDDTEKVYTEKENIKLFYIKKMVLYFEKILILFQKKYESLEKENFNNLNDYYKLLNNKIINLIDGSRFYSEITNLDVWGTSLLKDIDSLENNIDIFQLIGHTTIKNFNSWLYNKNLLKNGKKNHIIKEVNEFLKIIDGEIKKIEKIEPKVKLNVVKDEKININNISIKFYSDSEAYVYINGNKKKKITKEILGISEKPWKLFYLLSLQNITNAKTKINREILKNSLQLERMNTLETHKSKLNKSLKKFFRENYSIKNRDIISFDPNTESYKTLFKTEPTKEYRQKDIFSQSTGNFDPDKFSE